MNVRDVTRLESFDASERFLNTGSAWHAAFDFPFAQPRRLLSNIGVPAQWDESVRYFGSFSRDGFVTLLNGYRSTRPAGDKQHFRVVDALARSCSPMTLYGTPVGKMFYEGAPRLLEADVSILPMRPREVKRVAVEGYPKLVAERFAGRRKYKAEELRKQTLDDQRTRKQILQGVARHSCAHFGFPVRVARAVRELALADGAGDVLDAILCAVQAAWSARHASRGIPAGCDAIEGWIVDPVLLERRVRVKCGVSQTV